MELVISYSTKNDQRRKQIHGNYSECFSYFTKDPEKSLQCCYIGNIAYYITEEHMFKYSNSLSEILIVELNIEM